GKVGSEKVAVDAAYVNEKSGEVAADEDLSRYKLVDEQSSSFRSSAISFPIFGIIAAGYFYGRKHKPEMAVANRLNMDVFVPASVFAAMAGKSIDLGAYAPLALGGFIVSAVCGLSAWGLARSIGVQPKTSAPPMMFNNSGNIGSPLA
ncbi:hypothetical protein OY671_010352, partial [Metschnikowia pulcherrima]